MAAKISNWLGTRSQRSHLSAALFKAVNVVYLILDPPNVVLLLLQEKLDTLVYARIELEV